MSTPKEILIERTSSTGRKLKLTDKGIWSKLPERDSIFHEFSCDLDLSKVRKFDSSLSGDFSFILLDEGSLLLIALTAGATIFSYYLEPPQSSGIEHNSFLDACFTPDETKLVALTNHCSLAFFSVIPAKLIQEFRFPAHYPPTSFSLFPSLDLIHIQLEGGSTISFSMPKDFHKNILQESEQDQSLGNILSILQKKEENPEILPSNDEQDEYIPTNPDSLASFAKELDKRGEYLYKKLQQAKKLKEELEIKLNNAKIIRAQNHNRIFHAIEKNQELISRLQALIYSSEAKTGKIIIDLGKQYERMQSDLEATKENLDETKNKEITIDTLIDIRRRQIPDRIAVLEKEANEALDKRIQLMSDF